MSGSTHTQKKGGGDIFAIVSIRRTHTTTTRETDCSSHSTCVFRGVWDDEEVARPRKAEARVCDTADDLDAALVCMTLSLLCRLRDVRVFCAEEERDFFRSTYYLKSSHVPCVLLYFYKVVFFTSLSLSFFLSFFLSVSKSLRAVSLSLSLRRENFCV